MHTPVLVKETLEYLNLKPGENVIDATLDGAGHTKLFLEAIKPNGEVLGIEQDSKMIEFLKSEIRNSKSETWNNLIIAHGNFRNITEITKKYNFRPDTIFFDLGMSTWHLKESGKGFSFQKTDEILDMRMSKDIEITAAEILNSYSVDELSKIFREYGEEKSAHNFAKKITEKRKKRKIITVGDFINVLGTTHPKILARIFQSLRIFINDELSALNDALEKSFKILSVGGKIAVISYHSLEDRIVKNFFKKIGREKQGRTFKKPIGPKRFETQKNPSARSAKLRVLWKT